MVVDFYVEKYLIHSLSQQDYTHLYRLALSVISASSNLNKSVVTSQTRLSSPSLPLRAAALPDGPRLLDVTVSCEVHPHLHFVL